MIYFCHNQFPFYLTTVQENNEIRVHFFFIKITSLLSTCTCYWSFFFFFLCLVLKCEEQVASCQKELHEFRLTSCRKVYNCVVALILPTMYVPVVASIFSLNTIGIYSIESPEIQNFPKVVQSFT